MAITDFKKLLMNLIKRKSYENEYKVSQGKCKRDKTNLAVSLLLGIKL